MSFRDALLLRAAAIWTVLVWAIFVRNVVGDNHSTGFKVVHVLLAIVSIIFALAIWAVAARNRQGRREHAKERSEEG